MYSNKLVFCIKSNNTILREKNNVVFMPFNTPYSIFIKNENKKTAYVKIYVDGIQINKESINLLPKDKKDLFTKEDNNLFFKSNLEESIVKVSFCFQEKIENTPFDKDISPSPDICFNEDYSMEIKINGFKVNNKVENIETVKDKKRCPNCGKKFKYKFNYCPFDGTFLQEN